MKNEWPNLVSNGTIRLFNRWMEKKTCGGLRGAHIPQIEERHVFNHFYDKNGKLKVKITILEGICTERSTKPQENWTDVDEFNVCFYDLSEKQQEIVVAYEDPFDEFTDRRKWDDFLFMNSWSQVHYGKLLKETMTRLQELTEQRGLSRRMDKSKELHGWDAIANFLKKSVPTVVRLAKEFKMPVTLLGGMPYTTEAKLEEWKEKLLERQPFWKQVEEREKYRDEEKD